MYIFQNDLYFNVFLGIRIIIYIENIVRVYISIVNSTFTVRYRSRNVLYIVE